MRPGFDQRALDSPPQSPALPASNSSSYRRDIDGLRCIAIVAVILFHVGIPYIGGGFVGVDVFFVISGYLIGSHVYRETQANKFSLGRFYERRAKRILPAFFLVLSVCYLLGLLLLSAGELKRFAAQAVAAVASCSNFYFWLRAGYFAPKAAANPLLMTWSLGAEEQFYIFFPLLMMLLRRLRPGRILSVLGVLSVASFFLAMLSVKFYPTAAFYLLPSRAWEIGLGCILGIYEIQSVKSASQSVEGSDAPILRSGGLANELLALAGLLSILACCFFYTDQTSFPGLAALPPVVGAVLLIRTRQSWINRFILSATPLVSIGLVSYSWYLWHWPLLTFARISTGGPLSKITGCIVVLFALLLSVLSYFTVEQPLRRTKLTGPRLLTRYGIACIVFAIPAVLLVRVQGWPARYPQAAAVEAASRSGFPDTCLADYGQRALISSSLCIPPRTNDQPGIALMGDSHASALAYALRQQSAANGWLFYEFTKSSCPQLGAVTRAMVAYPHHAQECADFNAAALNRVLNDPGIQTVLLTGFWAAPFPSSKGSGFVLLGEPATGTAAQNWHNLESGLEQTIRSLKARNKRVIVATDVPRFEANPLTLTIGQAIPLRRDLRQLLGPTSAHPDSELRSNTISAVDREVDQILTRTAERNEVQYFDLTSSLCDEISCRFSSSGMPFYIDEQHLSLAGAHAALQDANLFPKDAKAQLNPDSMHSLFAR